MLSPISVPYVLDALIEAFRQQMGGVLHLSGEEELSYVDFARRLAKANGVDAELVTPVHSSEKGVNLLYKPRHPMLGMSRTSKRLGVLPEPLTLSLARI
jgi:dTDP-4-dehydrorhamnose reductase